MLMLLLLISLGVGILIGAVGVGGVLLIPALNVTAGLTIQQSMATALFTFIFTGIVGTWLFQKRGSIDWGITVPLCIGAALFGALGAWANTRLDSRILTLILAALIIFAGVYTMRSRKGQGKEAFAGQRRKQQWLLAVIGATVGFGSGLTGVGGPALSVPLLLLFGFSPLSAIGASQVIQILASLSGTVGNLQFGTIDFKLAAIVAAVEVLGVVIGVRIVHAVNAQILRKAVAILCLLVGAGLALRAFGIL
jgi:uncharacterized membrane protein YfcA